jgi:tRNA threonylcarbamoyladenosine biosynthesis protein TsaE
LTRRLESASAHDTWECGRRLGQAARAGDVLLLEGPLGAGKTVLVSGIAAGLDADADVQSPSFVLVREYRGRLPLIHADLYRLAKRDEIEALGLLDLSSDGLLVIEWADRAPWLAAKGASRVTLEPGKDENARVIALEGINHLSAAFGGQPY